jgi:DNA-binding beta-propeller fold protein YncE/tetratricopeptide (TPR) repeat protein
MRCSQRVLQEASMTVARHIGFIIFFSLLFVSRGYPYQQIDLVRELNEPAKQADEPRQFNAPRALAVTGGKLYLADTDAHRIIVLDQDGKLALSWGSKGSKAGQFKLPSGIAIDEKGQVYVSDTGNHRIQVFTSAGKLLRSFGSKGDGSREFRSPSGIAVSHGMLYLADTGNSRVLVLTTDGIFIREITLKALKKKDDAMKAPVGVAVDAQNTIYVLDAEANAVRVFDPSGAQVRVFGSRGGGIEGFEKPQGIAVDARGNIYVADTGNFKVKKFDPQNKLVGSAGTAGDGPGQFREAVGVVVGQEDRIWVLDAGKNTVQLFSTERDTNALLTQASPIPSVEFSKELRDEAAVIAINKRPWGVVEDSLVALGIFGGRAIGSRGSEPGLFKNPRGMAVDRQGNFWVTDTGNDRIQKVSIEGNLLQVIGKSGSGEGEFREPSGIAISPKGNLCIADTGNSRVQVFSPKGVFLGAFGKSGKLAGQFNELADIAVDTFENIYVVDRRNDRIAKTDSNGAFLWETGKTGKQDGEFNKPESIAVSPDGEVYVLDAGNARIQVFDSNGKFLRKFGSEGAGPGEFRNPRALALDDGLWLYVGDRGNKRVQVFLLKNTPAIPGEVSAQPKINEIQLSWKANAETYLEQYRIYRADSPAGPFTLIGTSTTPFYLDKNLPSNRSYHYRVSSQAKEGNESALAGMVTAVTPKLVPSQPKKVRLDPSEKQMLLSWLPNPEPFVSYYQVYRTQQLSEGFRLLTKTDKPIFLDGPLKDETLYYYQITAVGKEGDESPASEVIFSTTPKAPLTAPPIEISKIEISEIFSAAYKYYEAHALGKIVVTNNTERTYSKVKLGFTIKDFMDYPTEIEIAAIAPKQSVELQLKPVFSNKILDVTENTPLQSEIVLTYYVAGEPKTITRTFPVTLYERHAIRWDQKLKVGSFVTFKDQVVTDFTRSVVQPYIDLYPNLDKSIVYARAIYDALGVMGVAYLVDPTPYAEFSANSAIVDYTLYPRDVLSQKSGDCDGLSMMFAAAAENIGIETALIDVPGHVFVMFNTGVVEKDRSILGFPDESLVLYQGTAWVPLEMTMVGSSFTRAWQKGAEEYRDWTAKEKADIISIHKAWEQFKPVTLPSSSFSPGKVKSEEIEAKYKGELEALAHQRLVNLSSGYLGLLKKNPHDMQALAQLGILYGENGLFAEALEQFQKMLALDKTNALALNNIGNINYLQGRLDDARLAYEAALKSMPGEPGVMVNLTRVLLQSGKKEEAKKLFQDAATIDPRVVREYADLSAGLGVK